MKNIHLLPTDKPSRLYKRNDLKTYYLGDFDICNPNDNLRTNQHIYITSDEEIKEGDWCLYLNYLKEWNIGKYEFQLDAIICQKIILTDDEDLIKDGVQVIDDEFLEWFVKNPSCEWVDIETMMECEKCGKEHCDNLQCRGYKDILYYKIIIPKEEPKQDLEKEMFELEQELDIPSHLRWHNSKPKQETTLEEVFDISMLKEYLLDFVDWQNRCSKWVTIPESMVDDYLDWKKFKNK